MIPQLTLAELTVQRICRDLGVDYRPARLSTEGLINMRCAELERELREQFKRERARQQFDFESLSTTSDFDFWLLKLKYARELLR